MTEEYWDNVYTYQELQKATIKFLKGKLNETPYHFGPIHKETKLILPQLLEMNKLGCVTLNSEPFLEEEHKGKYYRQRPYIDFYMHNKYIDDFVTEFLKLNDTAMIKITDISYENGGAFIIYSNCDLTSYDKKIDLHQVKINDVYTDYHESTIWLDSGAQDDSDLFCTELENILCEDYVIVEICDINFSNDIFDQIVQIMRDLTA